MRLSPVQISAIKTTASQCFGAQAAVYLFGSRTDDARRGGDIDLFVETDMRDVAAVARAEIAFLVAVKQCIGEQRIDLVVDYPTRQERPLILTVAKNMGIRL